MNWQRGMRIILPPSVTQGEIGSVSGICPLEAYGAATWPETEGLDLASAQLNTSGEPAATKVYIGPMTERWEHCMTHWRGSSSALPLRCRCSVSG